MKLTLNVTTADDNYQVVTTFGNVVEWERKFKRQASDLARGIGYEDLAFLAFVASKSAGRVVPAVFDDFIKKIVELDVETDEPANPTQQGLGATD